jgi:predicted nucleic acid-binding protein
VSLAYVDTSVIVSIAFDDPLASDQLLRMRSYTSVHSAQLLEAELRSALRREQDVFDESFLHGITLVMPDRSLSAEIERVLECGYLRGADCWHLAVALHVASVPRNMTFLTLDKRQREVAEALGFAT